MYHLAFTMIFLSILAGSSISGLVKDVETDKIIENVNIILKNSNLGTVTNKDGNFEIRNLPIGNHQISFSMIGYKTF